MAYTLVTGASGGLGEEFAKEFASRGHDLILTARTERKLEELKKELETQYKIKAEVFAADLTQEEERKRLFAFTKQNGLEVDILINNAGFGDRTAYLDASWERHKKMVDLNVLALMHLAHWYGMEMKKRKQGRILNVASCAAFSAGPYMPVYYASKSFVLSLSEAMHEELKRDGITVTAVCPGPTTTGFEKNAGLEQSRMFTFLHAEKARSVVKKGCRGLAKGKAVVFHGKVAHVYNLVTRIVTRRCARNIAKRIN